MPDNTVQIIEELERLAGYVNNSAFLETWAERDALQTRFEKIVGNKKLSNLLIGIRKDKKPILDINKATEKLASLEQSKRILHYIAKKNRRRREQIKIYGLERLTDYFELAGERGSPYFVVPFEYDEEKGLPSVKRPLLLKIIQKREFESFDRVAVCPICDGVFWAKKTNALTCGNQKCIDGLQYKKKKLKEQK